MQLLSALVLTHCLGCVFLEGSDDEGEFKELCTFRSTENDLKRDSNNLTEENIHLANVDSIHRMKSNELVSQGHEKKSFIINSRHNFCCLKNSINYHRRLLSYTEKNSYKHPGNEQFRGTGARLRKKEQKVFPKEVEKTDENHNVQWDEWGNWSTCSVTCGSGRQVRWRHCSTGNCITGLKKAQIKPCRLKDCNSKNILHWLGI